MAFNKIGSLLPHGAPVLVSRVVSDSITVTINDSVKLSSGLVALGTAGALVYGHVMSLSTDLGLGLNSDGTTGSQFGSFVNTFSTSATNSTVEKVKAQIDISKYTLYSAELDATIGSTTGSDLAGYYMDLIDEDTLDESSAATSSAQYTTEGIDPRNSAQAVVHIYESQAFGV